jgi:hypothetical protein
MMGHRRLSAAGSCRYAVNDLLCGPLGPLEEPALVQRQRHRKRLRLPWLAKHRAFGILRQIG